MESIKIQFKGGEGATADVCVCIFFGHPVAGSLVGVSVPRLERMLVKGSVTVAQRIPLRRLRHPRRSLSQECLSSHL